MRNVRATSLIDAQESIYGSLFSLFSECRELLRSIQVDAESGRLATPYCLLIRDDRGTQGERISEIVRDDYQLHLAAPFEGVGSISGGCWRAVDCGLAGNDAILKLRFAPKTVDLPIHMHAYSDRVIHVVGGSGTFRVWNGGETSSHSVSSGCSLVFSRGLAHTFRTDSEELLLLSYHSPFIDIQDPRQFEVCQVH